MLSVDFVLLNLLSDTTLDPTGLSFLFSASRSKSHLQDLLGQRMKMLVLAGSIFVALCRCKAKKHTGEPWRQTLQTRDTSQQRNPFLFSTHAHHCLRHSSFRSFSEDISYAVEVTRTCEWSRGQPAPKPIIARTLPLPASWRLPLPMTCQMHALVQAPYLRRSLLGHKLACLISLSSH